MTRYSDHESSGKRSTFPLSSGHDDRDRRTWTEGTGQNALVRLILAAFVGGICLILLGFASDFLVDWLWFSSIGYLPVFLTSIGAKALVFFTVLTATAVVLWLNGSLAVRFAGQHPTQAVTASVSTPTGSTSSPNLFALMRDRLPWSRVVAGGAALLALLVATAEAGNWCVFLQFLYRVPYGAADPLYNKDIGFYIFSLPAYVLIKNWMLLTLVLSALLPERSTGCTAISNTTLTADRCRRLRLLTAQRWSVFSSP